MRWPSVAGRLIPAAKKVMQGAARQEKAIVSVPTVEQAQQWGELILVAEDNAINRKVMDKQLERLGYASEFFVDGAEALEAWATGRYGIVLTDCHMPVMDGFALARTIRETEKAENKTRIPIVAVTASALAEELQACLDAGMHAHLTKPLNSKKLSETIARYLQSTKPLEPGTAPAAGVAQSL